MYKTYRNSSNISGLADFCQLWLPTSWQAGTSTPLVLLALGSGDNAQAIVTSSPIDTFAKAITRAGYGVVLSQYGDSQSYGNPTVRTQVGKIADFVQTGANTFGTPYVGAGKLVLVGFSMGGMTTLNWAGNISSPTNRVKAMVGISALVDANYASQASQISAAYPSGINNSTDDPTTMAAAGKYAGINITMCYSSNDGVVPASSMASFVAATGATQVNIGAVGHTWANIALPAVTDHVIAACRAA